MVPYIALLIVLIVAVLFAVYHRVDGFFVNEVSWTTNTTVKEMVNFYEASLDEVKKLKDRLTSSPAFDDNTLTEEKLTELALPFAWTKEKGLQYEKPLSALLRKRLEQEEKEISAMLTKIRNDLASGKISETMTFSEVMKAMGMPEPMDMTPMNEFTNMSVKLRNKRKAYIDEKLGASPGSVKELTCPTGRPPFSQNGKLFCRDLMGKVSPTPLTCPSGTNTYLVYEDQTGKWLCLPSSHPYVTNPGSALTPGQLGCKETEVLVMNISNNSQKCVPKEMAKVTTPELKDKPEILGVSTDDLFKVVGGVQQALKASKPAEIEKVLAPAPQQTSLSTKEMEERIARNVARQLKDSLILERAAATPMSQPPCPYASAQSDATAQGTEYAQARPNPGPDMSEYIRKDSIPCWNCSLP